VIKSGPQSIDGKWYYFGEDGTMETGWKQIGDKWYYLLDTGEFSIGWQNIGGKWYYFASNGEMKTDQYIDGYYIGADGVMTDKSINTITASSENTDYKKLYRDVLTKLYTKHELEGGDGVDTETEISESREPKYTLLDMTGDGKAELIIYAKLGISRIYGAKDGKISVLFHNHMEDGCHILNDNSIVEFVKSHDHQIDNSFVLYKYSNQTGKFEEYMWGSTEDKLYESLMNNVKYGIWEVANIPVTPENIATIK